VQHFLPVKVRFTLHHAFASLLVVLLRLELLHQFWQLWHAPNADDAPNMLTSNNTDSTLFMDCSPKWLG